MKKDGQKKIWNWTPVQNKKRGRPKTSWKQGVTTATMERGLQDENCLNRRQWKLDAENIIRCRKIMYTTTTNYTR